MIQILSDSLVKQIAAGEVVERPSSIVKELVENAIDASSTLIHILIEDGGRKITVIDNGKGISKEDLPLVFKNHATSKISSLNDLENIHSLGFRGEAMASISSISNVTLISSTGNDAGYKIKDNEISPSSANKGTTVIVEDVFYNTPARKKFLKTDSTEFKYISETVLKLSLANPHIGFVLKHNAKTYIDVSPGQSLEERIKKLLKLESIIPLYYDGKIKVSGYIIDPKFCASRPSNQYIVVNGRFISSSFLNRAVVQGYGNSLMKGEYPSYVVVITVPSNEIDVNVHPRKTEVRFKNEPEVFQSVYYSVKDALEKFQKQLISSIGNINIQKTQTQRDFRTQSSTSNYFQAAIDFNKQMSTSVQTNDMPYEMPVKQEIYECMQIHNSFIVTSNSSNLQIIDQHAASERILFEKILNQIENSAIEKQVLMFAQNLTLTPPEATVLRNNLEIFTAFGFEIDPFGENEFQIRSLPQIIPAEQAEKAIKEIIYDDFKATNLENRNKNIAASIACHSAVRFGDKLEKSEMLRIINDIKQCKNPYTCPHGRPVVHSLSNYELLKIFKRV